MTCIEARSRVHCRSGKTISITYSECMSLALVSQNAKRMCRIVLSSVACTGVQCFSTLSHQRHDFSGKKLLIVECVFWFLLQLFSGTFHILRRIKRDTVINVHRSSCKVTHSCQILTKLDFFPYSFEEYTNIKLHENPSSGSRIVPCERNEAAGCFSQFCERT
jgi:hypothetical protein